MKIAISTEGNNLNSLMDMRFGRCKYFYIGDTEKNQFKFVENQGTSQGHGAGIKAAEQLGNLGVQAVITGNLGPNATDILNKLGIKAYGASGKVEAALDLFKKNELKEINDIATPHSKPTQKESERIFFPLLDDNGNDSKISEHFGHAPFFGVYDVENKELKIIENKLNHSDPKKYYCKLFSAYSPLRKLLTLVLLIFP